MNGELLTPREAADYLKVPLRTLDAWRYRRQGPNFMKIGRRVRYTRAQLDEFCEQSQIHTTRGADI